MKYLSREERMSNAYKKIEAMYWKGNKTYEDMARETGLPMEDVLDIVQKIFYFEQLRPRRLGSAQ